jgi:hypothetical protein
MKKVFTYTLADTANATVVAVIYAFTSIIVPELALDTVILRC